MKCMVQDCMQPDMFSSFIVDTEKAKQAAENNKKDQFFKYFKVLKYRDQIDSNDCDEITENMESHYSDKIVMHAVQLPCNN